MKNNLEKPISIEADTRKKVEGLTIAVQNLSNFPETFTYIKIYQLVNELYGMKCYLLASDICDCTIKYLDEMEAPQKKPLRFSAYAEKGITFGDFEDSGITFEELVLRDTLEKLLLHKANNESC